jgi:hypothetical protein
MANFPDELAEFVIDGQEADDTFAAWDTAIQVLQSNTGRSKGIQERVSKGTSCSAPKVNPRLLLHEASDERRIKAKVPISS